LLAALQDLCFAGSALENQHQSFTSQNRTCRRFTMFGTRVKPILEGFTLASHRKTWRHVHWASSFRARSLVQETNPAHTLLTSKNRTLEVMVFYYQGNHFANVFDANLVGVIKGKVRIYIYIL